MKKRIHLRPVLEEIGADSAAQLEGFAVINLGLVQSLLGGVLSVVEAVDRFYNAENCLYVKRQLKGKLANEIMSRGCQLADIQEFVSADEAQRELANELDAIRALSLELLRRDRGKPRRARGRSATV